MPISGSAKGLVIRLIRAMLITLVTAFVSHEVSAQTSTDAASLLVSKQNLGANLSAIASATAIRTQTYKMIANKVGASNGQALVKGEIERLTPKYQEPWNKNLAAAYAGVFSAEELSSVARDGRASKYMAKFSSLQGDVGKRMQTMSTPLLTEFVTEAITNAYAKSLATK